MQLQSILFVAAWAAYAQGAAISGSRVQDRAATAASAAAGTKCSTVAGAVGVAVVCNGPNGKTINGQPAQQAQQPANNNQQQSGTQTAGAQAPTQSGKKTPKQSGTKTQAANKGTGTASAAGTQCTEVAGLVGASQVCKGPNGFTINGQPAGQVQPNTFNANNQPKDPSDDPFAA